MIESSEYCLYDNKGIFSVFLREIKTNLGEKYKIIDPLMSDM